MGETGLGGGKYNTKQATVWANSVIRWRQKSIGRWDFPGGPVVKNPSCNARDAGSIPGQGTEVPQLERSLRATTQSQRAQTKDPACHNWPNAAKK